METNNEQSKTVSCPDCRNAIKLDSREYKVGDLVDCPICGAVVEVVEVKPAGEVVVNIVEQEK